MTIPYGEAGTNATVDVMRSMIEAGKRDPFVRQLAERILRRYRVPRYQCIAELAALHDWVRRNVRYTKDPHEVEYIQTPRRLLQGRMGDCDDMAVLLGSLAEVIGHPIGIKVVSRDANRNFHHVYPVAEVEGREIGLDASVPFPFGYQSPDIKKQRIFPSNGVGDMRDVYYGLGKIPPGEGGDGSAAGGTIPITFGPDPRAQVKISVLGPGARICGPDVDERMYKGTIRPNLSTTRLRLISAAESGAGVPCVVAEMVSVYERPIEPPIVNPPGMLDISAPITLREGQRLCRPDIRTLFERGLIKAASGTVLRFAADTTTGTPCAAAVVPTDVSIPTQPDIFIPPTDVRKPGVTVLEIGQGMCHPNLRGLVGQGAVRAASGSVLLWEETRAGQEQCVRAVSEREGRIAADEERREWERRIDVAQEKPDIFMPPPIEAIPEEHRAEYEPVPYRPPGVMPAGIVEAAQEEGPLGLPWIVWIGAAGLLVTVLMKK